MAWANLHQAIFGNHSDSWLDTYRVWDRLFRLEGISESELEGAVLAVSRRPKIPKFAGEHLEAIREEIKGLRLIEERKNYANALPGPGVGECALCGDAGLICGMPHLDDIRLGHWFSGYTVGIVCRCLKGKWFGEKCRPNDQPLMGIAEYETRNPYWREQIQARKEKQDLESAESQKWKTLKATNPDEMARELARRFSVRSGKS